MEGINTFEFREPTGGPVTSALSTHSELPFAAAAPEVTILSPAPNVFDVEKTDGWNALPEEFAGENEPLTATTVTETTQFGVPTPWRPPELPRFTSDPQDLAAGIHHTAAQISNESARAAYLQYANQSLSAAVKKADD